MATTINADTVTGGLIVTGDATGELALQAGGTTVVTVDTSGASLGDNKKIILGDGDDLQIYHDGSNSVIADGGTGALITYSSDFIIQQNGSNERMADFAQNGAVRLYYNGIVKLATTTTGVDVTGDISATGQISGNVSLTPQVITASTTGSAGNYYFLNAAGLTLTLPASPSAGDVVGFSDVANDTTHTIGRNGSNIMGDAADMTVDTAYQNFTLMYTGATVGWAFAR